MPGEVRNERATVRTVGDGIVQVAIDRPVCEKEGGCGLCTLAGDGRMVLEVETDLELTEGQEVRLEIRQPPILCAVFLVFVLPVIALLGGIALGRALFGPWGALLGLALPAVTCIAIIKYDRYLRTSQKAAVRIVTDDR